MFVKSVFWNFNEYDKKFYSFLLTWIPKSKLILSDKLKNELESELKPVGQAFIDYKEYLQVFEPLFKKEQRTKLQSTLENIKDKK